jgi:stage V sporulation protein SpoVS
MNKHDIELSLREAYSQILSWPAIIEKMTDAEIRATMPGAIQKQVKALCDLRHEIMAGEGVEMVGYENVGASRAKEAFWG